MDTRRLVLGDWSPVVRDGFDVLRLVILGGAVAYALVGRTGSAALLVLLGGITLLGRLINLPRVFDLALTLGMALQGFGETFASTTSGCASTTSSTSRCHSSPRRSSTSRWHG